MIAHRTAFLNPHLLAKRVRKVPPSTWMSWRAESASVPSPTRAKPALSLRTGEGVTTPLDGPPGPMRPGGDQRCLPSKRSLEPILRSKRGDSDRVETRATHCQYLTSCEQQRSWMRPKMVTLQASSDCRQRHCAAIQLMISGSARVSRLACWTPY